MDVTKPYKFIGFGAMDVTKTYKFIGFGAMDVTKPYKFIGLVASMASTVCLAFASCPASSRGPRGWELPGRLPRDSFLQAVAKPTGWIFSWLQCGSNF